MRAKQLINKCFYKCKAAARKAIGRRAGGRRSDSWWPWRSLASRGGHRWGRVRLGAGVEGGRAGVPFTLKVTGTLWRGTAGASPIYPGVRWGGGTRRPLQQHVNHPPPPPPSPGSLPPPPHTHTRTSTRPLRDRWGSNISITLRR